MSNGRGQVIASKYRLLERLGRGAIGEVWCARNETIDREVALKMIAPDWAVDAAALQRFFADAKASGKLRHPSIVELLDLGETGDDVAFVVMELLEAEKLDGVLERRKKLAVGTGLRLCGELASALVLAHEKGLPHLRLEPANVLLHRQGRSLVPKLVDFGIARFVQDAAPPSSMKVDLSGPLAYLAPEQLDPSATPDGAADVFALGVLLHHAILGAPPFRAATRDALKNQHATVRPSPKQRDPKVDPRIASLILDCLALQAELRPAMAEVAGRLELLGSGLRDGFADLAGSLVIPENRTLAYFGTLGGEEAIPLSGSSIESAPISSMPVSSSQLEEIPPSSDAAPLSSSNLEDVGGPPPLQAPLPLVTRSTHPKPNASSGKTAVKTPLPTPTPAILLGGKSATSATSATTASARPVGPPVPRPKPATPVHGHEDTGPVSQLIARRFNDPAQSSQAIEQLDDLEDALLAQVAASRASVAKAVPPLPTPELPAVASETPPSSAKPEAPVAVAESVRTGHAPPPPLDDAAGSTLRASASPMTSSPPRAAPPASKASRYATMALVVAAIFAAAAYAYRESGATGGESPSPAPEPTRTTTTAPSAPTAVSPPSASITSSSSAAPSSAASSPDPAPTTSASSSAVPSPSTTPTVGDTAVTPTSTAPAPPTATSSVPPSASYKPKPKPSNDPTFGVTSSGI